MFYQETIYGGWWKYIFVLTINYNIQPYFGPILLEKKYIAHRGLVGSLARVTLLACIMCRLFVSIVKTPSWAIYIFRLGVVPGCRHGFATVKRQAEARLSETSRRGAATSWAGNWAPGDQLPSRKRTWILHCTAGCSLQPVHVCIQTVAI